MPGKLTQPAARGGETAVGKLAGRNAPVSKIDDRVGRLLQPFRRARFAEKKSRQSETLAKKSFDPLWERMLRVFEKANAAWRAHSSKTVEGIVLIARLYEREAERWEDFLAQRGVRRPRRGPTSRSRFHSLAKHVLQIDSDEDGTASRLAAILDQWHAQRDRIAPDQIPNWIASQGGITRLYESAGERRDAGPDPEPRRRRLPWDIDKETSSYERYTPEELFTAMDVVFDTDVCSPGARRVPWIPARRHITARQDALSMAWDDFGFVYMNCPWGIRYRVEEWIDKFIRHANGVALVPDFTSVGWWHTLCRAADVIMAVKPKIKFHSSAPGPGNVLGSTLVAIGAEGEQALRNAEKNGRGICFARLRSRRTDPDSEGYVIMPAREYAPLDEEFHFVFDPCPHPRPPGFDGLSVPWGQSNFVNPPFRRINGQGPTKWVRKAVKEHRKGKTIVMVLPTQSYVNALIAAGAEVRPLGRVRWLHARTGKPSPSPSPITAFILRGNHHS